jgi:hypothetical protein
MVFVFFAGVEVDPFCNSLLALELEQVFLTHACAPAYQIN